MARPKSKTVKIALRVPAGIKVANSVLAEATRAAQAILNEHNQFAAISQELATKGITISPQELSKRASAGKPAAGSPKRKSAARSKAPAKKGGRKRRRTVLTDAQRSQLIAKLKAGATVAATAKEYKCSPQTVMTIKKKAGMVKAKKTAKKKTAAKRK